MRKVKCSKANIALSPIIMYNKTVCKQPKAGEGFMQKIKDFCKRHRLLWLYLTRETDLLTDFPRTLHIAPEVCIMRHLKPAGV